MAPHYTAPTLGRPASTIPAQDRCARCGKAFDGPDDRRAQPRAPDLCAACHLDPRARALPLDTDLGGNWLGRCVRSLKQLVLSPDISFRMVDEPVAHARVLKFLATLRLPLWLIAINWAGLNWSLDKPGPLRRPSVIGEMVGAQFADVLRLWLLQMVPIGLPMLYFFGGMLGHIGVALTGGARRSIGASMRAFGLALAPSLLLVGVLDVLVIGLKVEPEIWFGVLVLAGLIGLVLLSVAMARTHATTLGRGFVVALLPLALFLAVSAGRGLLEYYRLPFMPPPPIDSYAPYPIQ